MADYARRPINFYTYLRSQQWLEKKLACFVHAGWLCERCRMRRANVAHHLDYRRLGYEEPEDLQALCWRCHEEIHVPVNDNQITFDLEPSEWQEKKTA